VKGEREDGWKILHSTSNIQNSRNPKADYLPDTGKTKASVKDKGKVERITDRKGPGGSGGIALLFL